MSKTYLLAMLFSLSFLFVSYNYAQSSNVKSVLSKLDELVKSREFFLKEVKSKRPAEGDRIYDNFRKEFAKRLDAIDLALLNTKEIEALKKKIYPGFTVDETEGGYFLGADKKYMIDHFGKYLSKPMLEYLDFQMDQYFTDGGLIVTFDELAGRIVSLEKFLDLNNAFSLKKETEDQYRSYLSVYLGGVDNTPVFDNNKMLIAEVKSSYEDFIKNYSNTNSVKLVRSYFNILSKNNFAENDKSDEILSAINTEPRPEELQENNNSLIETLIVKARGNGRNNSQVFTYVEEMPAFPDGEDAMYSYIKESLIYPELAKDNGVEGKVYIQFVVGADGSISDVTVAKGIGAGCDEEAVRVVSSMPNWSAGRQNGKTVNVRISVPIVFKL